MNKTVNIYEAKTHFSELINSVMNGSEIFIAKAGKPVAKIVSLEGLKPKVKFGLLRGKFKIPEDFDAPLSEDVIDLFEGQE